MSDHHHNDPVDANLLEEMGYERSDVNFGNLSKSVAIFFVASTIIMAAGLFAMWLWAPKMTFDAPKERMEARANKPTADVPLIQSNATAQVDMTEFQARQHKAMTEYAWTDRKSGHVRIPIEEAMKRVLAKGLPSRPSPEGVKAAQ